MERAEKKLEELTQTLYHKTTKRWKVTVYDEGASYAYLLAKAAFDYAVTRTVLQEIKSRDPEYQPRTLFDYGSGVGSSIW